MRLWSVATGREVKRFEGHEGWVSSVAFNADGQHLVSGSRDNTVRLWSVATGREVKRFEGHEGWVSSVAFNADGQHLVSGSRDNTVRLWSVATGREVKRFEGHEGDVASVAFSADGQHIISGSWDMTVRLWSVSTGREVKRFEGHADSVLSVAFNADGQHIISGSWDETVRLWSVSTGREVKRFEGHWNDVNSIAFSTNGEHLVSGSSDNTVRLWSISTGHEVKRFKGHEGNVTSVAISTDGEHLVSGSRDKTVRLWSISTGHEVKRFEGHEAYVSSVAFSADGQHLVSGSWDNTVRLWSVSTGREVKRFEGHQADFISIAFGDFVRSVALSADGQHIVSGSYDDLIRLWTLPKNIILLERVQSLIPRCLTKTEREAYFLSPIPPRWCITGAGLEHEKDPTKWQPKYPYHTKAWKDWLVAKDAGKDPQLLPFEIAKEIGDLQLKGENGLKKKDYKQAITSYTEILKFQQTPGVNEKQIEEAVFNRAIALRAEGKYDQAIDDFRKAKELGKKEIDAWIWWTKMYKAAVLAEKGKTIPSLLLATSYYLSIKQEVKKNYTKKNFQIDFFTGLWQSSYPMVRLYANHKQNRPKAQKITECDQLASHPNDPFRLSAPIQVKDINVGKAKPACDRAIEQNKHEPRYYLNRARVLSKMAEQEKDKTKASVLFKAMHADLDKAMSLDYPMAFNNKGYAYGEGQGVVKDEMRRALLNLETFNRIVHCCALSVSQHLMQEKDKHDLKTVYKVVKALLRWAVALKAEGAAIFLEDLYEKNVLARSPALPTATFKSVPPWLKYD